MACFEKLSTQKILHATTLVDDSIFEVGEASLAKFIPKAIELEVLALLIDVTKLTVHCRS